MPSYKHPNKRIARRGAGGRFRSSTGFELPPRSCHRCGADVDLMGWA
jgi:hypothetical protein